MGKILRDLLIALIGFDKTRYIAAKFNIKIRKHFTLSCSEKTFYRIANTMIRCRIYDKDQVVFTLNDHGDKLTFEIGNQEGTTDGGI